MKLRVYDNQVRLRLSRAEVVRVARGETIEERADLVPQPLVVRLVTDDVPLACRFADGTLTIRAERVAIQRWADGDDVGLSRVDAAGVRVLIEKDFQCLHGDDEDQPDCFPNPLADISA